MKIRSFKTVSLVMALALLISLSARGNQNVGQTPGTETTLAGAATDSAESAGISILTMNRWADSLHR